jgi:hypothetical protein
VEVELQSFLTLALGGGEWSASHPGHFTCWGKSYQNPLNRESSWSGCLGTEKSLLPLLGFVYWTVQPVASSLYWLHYWAKYRAFKCSVCGAYSKHCALDIYVIIQAHTHPVGSQEEEKLENGCWNFPYFPEGTPCLPKHGVTFRCVAGFLFCVWINTGNSNGSLIKKMGVLLPTRSQMPSSV